MGADHVINIKNQDSRYFVADLKQEIAHLSNGNMADRVLVSTGNPDVMGLPFDISGKGSVIVFFGLPGEKDVVPVPALDTAFGDKRIKFSWLAPLTWPQALRAIATGSVRLNELITHRFQLDELVTAMGKVKRREGNSLKAMVIP
jgi:L-iditol 2-dehydrogenase